MALEPRSIETNDANSQWEFVAQHGRLHFRFSMSGSVPLEFAEQALRDAVHRKNKAITSRGDGISLDLVLGGFPKEAIEDFGNVVFRGE